MVNTYRAATAYTHVKTRHIPRARDRTALSPVVRRGHAHTHTNALDVERLPPRILDAC